MTEAGTPAVSATPRAARPTSDSAKSTTRDVSGEIVRCGAFGRPPSVDQRTLPVRQPLPLVYSDAGAFLCRDLKPEDKGLSETP